jgi:DNA-binding HxlR family transcriptional regulator
LPAVIAPGPVLQKTKTGKNQNATVNVPAPGYRYMAKKRMYVCSLEAAMDVIGGKWKPHILWKIKDAPLRFGAIQEKLPAISPKMLTRQLRALEADRLVSRTEYPGMPPRVEYALTERGRTVIPILMSLKDWADDELADQINESH